ncbi:TPA: hypothetical protein ACGVAU_004303 [Vibrio vulnificus]
MSDQFQALIESNRRLTDIFEGKVKEIDKKVEDAVGAVPQAIIDNFTKKNVKLDPINGDDSSVNGPFKTLKAAILSIPDGGNIVVEFPYSSSQEVVELDEGIGIGSRIVVLKGGWSGMENSGLKACVLRPLAGFNETFNRTYMRGYISGEPGGRVYILNLLVEMPRIIEGSTIEHGLNGAFITGGVTVTTHHYSISGPHIYYVEGTTRPMYFLRSSARDGKANLQDFTISYTHIQTSLGEPIINLQYGTGTLRFAYYGGNVSDKEGATVTYANIFDGLSYGDHGYATNILANGSMLKQPVEG